MATPFHTPMISNHLVFIGGEVLDRRRDKNRMIQQKVGVAVEKHWLNKSVGAVALVAQ
jgi:hypothetical protein